ncbi:MAG TPA: response regulator [Nitrososphaeraceae archaeon]|nr:response regulator [Nitrososphaeraceae archaeon]
MVHFCNSTDDAGNSSGGSNTNTSLLHSYDESKVISSSHLYTKYHYDKIITKLHLQVANSYEKSRKRRLILLVDDEPDTCMVYQIVLQDAGYECISYTDSVTALEEFKPNYYDLVILDIKMPKLDGFALCEKIREVDKTARIIFITAAEQYYEKFRNKYYPRLNNDPNINCLQKPIGNEELVQIVNMTIATKDIK